MIAYLIMLGVNPKDIWNEIDDQQAIKDVWKAFSLDKNLGEKFCEDHLP